MKKAGKGKSNNYNIGKKLFPTQPQRRVSTNSPLSLKRKIPSVISTSNK